jgi:hypothetical protein
LTHSVWLREVSRTGVILVPWRSGFLRRETVRRGLSGRFRRRPNCGWFEGKRRKPASCLD